MNFIQELETELFRYKNTENAAKMEAYMKHHFSFLGIKTETRRAVFQDLWKKHQSEIQSNFREISWELFNKKEREFQYCGMEILIKEIIVSPYSPKWFVSTLQKLVLDLGYSFEVTQSELYNLK